jgi:hypothetical protein
MPASQRSNEFGEIVSWFVSKFGAFLSNDMMRNIIGQTKSAFNLRDIMDNNKILLVNLSRGRTGDLNSKLLGMIFVMKFEAAAMSRADIPEEYRKDFCLYVDEFQNFSTESFADILSQARKYRLNLIVANQFTTQLSEEVRDAVFGNVGTVISFRVGTADAEFLEKQFRPVFDIDDLQFLPNANTVVRMMIGGVPVQPFSMATLPPLGNPNNQLAEALKQLSAAKYGRPKAVVEAEIYKRMATEPARPSLSSGPGGNTLGQPPRLGPTSAGSLPPAGGSSASKPPGPGGPASFLDEWLAKRKKNAPNTPVPGASPASANKIKQPAASAPPIASSAPPTPPVAEEETKKVTDLSQVEDKLGVQEPAPDPNVFKINQEDGKEQVHTVKIDRDGNISFGDNDKS